MPKGIFRIKLMFLMFFVVFFTLFYLALLSPNPTFASMTDGTIDTTFKYAWGEESGWINFGCDNCNVHVTDTSITGYAWSVDYGWINLTPALSGVTNTSAGVLSGSAWGNNIGWINFSGVTINSSGEFLGYATVQNDNSVINFNCVNVGSCATANYKVKTDWRPASVRGGGGGGTGGGGTGGSGGGTGGTGGGGTGGSGGGSGTGGGGTGGGGTGGSGGGTGGTGGGGTGGSGGGSGTGGGGTGGGGTGGGTGGGGTGGSGGGSGTGSGGTPPGGGTGILPVVISFITSGVNNGVAILQNSFANPEVRKLEQVSLAVPVVISTVVIVTALVSGIPLLNYLFYLLIALMQILGIKKTPKPWGTVYDSVTKRPIPFARVEILNQEQRKLQSVITDENGRYGFLLSDDLSKNSLELKAFRTKYDFPSKENPTSVEQELYPNIYMGGPVNISSAVANFDLPMDPRDASTAKSFYFGIVSVQLNNALADVANILFIIGAVLGITNAIVNPNKNNFIILGIILLTFIIRSTGFKLKPFGLTKDKTTTEVIPFGFVALHNQTGERVNFTVSDDKGRYFLLTGKGGYTLKAFTPAHILPTRTKEVPIFTSKGWISKEIDI